MTKFIERHAMALWPLLANPGKLIQKIFWNFSFPGQTDFRKTHPFFQNFNFRGMSWTVQPEPISGKLIHIFTTKCSVLDEFSRNRSNSCPETLPITVISNKGSAFPSLFHSQIRDFRFRLEQYWCRSLQFDSFYMRRICIPSLGWNWLIFLPQRPMSF